MVAILLGLFRLLWRTTPANQAHALCGRHAYDTAKSFPRAEEESRLSTLADKKAASFLLPVNPAAYLAFFALADCGYYILTVRKTGQY
jgi:hypothetical protein